MCGIAFVVVVTCAFVAAMAGGAVVSLVVALAASAASALGGAFLHWPEKMIWSALLAPALLLLICLLGARLLDRLARNAEFRSRRKPAEDLWPNS